MKILKTKVLLALIITLITGSASTAMAAGTTSVEVSLPAKTWEMMKNNKLSIGASAAVIAAAIVGGVVIYRHYKHDETVGEKIDNAGDDAENTADDAADDAENAADDVKDSVENAADDVKDQFKK